MTEGVKAFLRRYNAWVAPKGEAVKVFSLRCKGWATSKAESIKAFLRRHKGWLTVLGAGVILATYVMKDILRDNERDLKDAVETARRAFVVGRGIHGLYESVLSLSYRVNSRLDAILEKGKIQEPPVPEGKADPIIEGASRCGYRGECRRRNSLVRSR
jgi:hypothetical protein